ncbi:translation initiation factor 2B subunit II family (IF-2BII) [Haloarcula quadrata]|jgi:translation initiation factor eIF-2B subunit delta|uniref:Translation initiation factor eIF-2B n=3 Tax=Haloarcula TaxID=2237 RepID=Q5V557_HALMA|nr:MULTISPECIES: translation initiation factor eIF-2B [Haloarcula]AAV45345.1 translation initiation factor eIF-2B subunit delta [Haloarcula marismortui ATCC 43049]EMA22033.1 initiation factor 2B-like protein [Haloarcula californiae ATCC 33799]NHN65621.1 translation initiation factor eIF-2B [Haloarcula sp. JP-Z28]QCP93121.1 translation initiation factor eIF-2B [Haloarcula marismortui ATCC 43049]RKS82046.1 translation initiation factor 2B subunit II family (IF-2BII) [Haloarcula quadrata]
MIDETVEEISEMQTHSSSVVAVKAAQALRDLTDREYPTVEDYLRSLDRNSSALRRANPSHASLHTTQHRIVNTVSDAEPDDVAAAKELTNEAIDDVIDSVESSKDRAAARAVSEIADDDVLLTHDFSSTVLAAIDDAIEAGHSFEVYVTESRPRFLGRKMTRHLSDRDGVDVTLIVDSAAGHFMPEVDRVLVGMDCIVDDTLYNRIGTYPIATAAADNDVPVTVVGAAAKYVDGAFAFENEIRPLSEVLREPADGFEVANPAYDATPTHLLDTVVTDDGVHEY